MGEADVLNFIKLSNQTGRSPGYCLTQVFQLVFKNKIIAMSKRVSMRQLIQSLSPKRFPSKPPAPPGPVASVQIVNALLSELPLVTVQEFQLGDKILAFQPTTTPAAELPQEQRCYLVYDGRVRLLCHNEQLQRRVTATVLESGDLFGADHHFCPDPLPYEAIAAGPCRIAQFSYSDLIALSDKFAPFREYCCRIAQQRAQLVFFKGCTQLRSLPSHALKQVLLPLLVQQQVHAGEPLVEATPAPKGHFWLRTGEIRSQSQDTTTPSIGASWGYPDCTPGDWIAATDLVIYQLLLDCQEIPEILYLSS